MQMSCSSLSVSFLSFTKNSDVLSIGFRPDGTFLHGPGFANTGFNSEVVL